MKRRQKIGRPLLLAFVLELGTFGTHGSKAPFVQTEAHSSIVKEKTAMPASHRPLKNERLTPRRDYIGDAVCSQCHQDKVESYNKTAHHLTSQLAKKDAIVGNFAPGSNTMATANPNLSFRMDEKGNDFFQTAIWGLPGASATAVPFSSPTSGTRTRTERLDLVIGSGGKGQTYLFWEDDALFQLPVGYSTVYHQWINSPGYADGTADFQRAIVPRCLECHATYFESVFPGTDSNEYDTKNFVLGVSCESCHGPGRKHAESYNSNSPIHRASTIINPAKLSPARRADVCAQCHGGPGEREILPAFSYVPGQPLAKYIDLGPIDSAVDVDVHGKQGKLMMRSRCYLLSASMNCSTCHDVHKTEPDLAAMSEHCLSCHKVQASVTHAKVGDGIMTNCIDCHMPMLESKVVSLDVNGKSVRPRFRSHWIKIYSETERQ
jgi:Cytochrome c554 and c-prime